MNKFKAHTFWGVMAMICMIMAVISGILITHKPKRSSLPDFDGLDD